jgi:hypothetical protein
MPWQAPIIGKIVSNSQRKRSQSIQRMKTLLRKAPPIRRGRPELKRADKKKAQEKVILPRRIKRAN